MLGHLQLAGVVENPAVSEEAQHARGDRNLRLRWLPRHAEDRRADAREVTEYLLELHGAMLATQSAGMEARVRRREADEASARIRFD